MRLPAAAAVAEKAAATAIQAAFRGRQARGMSPLNWIHEIGHEIEDRFEELKDRVEDRMEELNDKVEELEESAFQLVR